MKRDYYHLLLGMLMALVLMAAPGAAQEAVDKPADTAAAAVEGTVLGPEQAPVTIVDVPRYDIKDLYGRVIAGKDLEGWIVLYCFGNENTADEGIQWLKQLTLKHFNAEGILYVIVADTSKYHKALFPMVKKQAKGAYESSLANFKKELDEREYKYDFALEDRYIMTLDTGAAVFDLFQIQDRTIPHVIIMDADHKVRGHYTHYTDEAADLLGQVLAEREAKKKAAEYQLTMKTRKRQMWKRYALLGAAAWLVLR